MQRAHRVIAADNCQGFTIVELMVVLAVAGILLTLAAPGLRLLTGGETRSSLLNELTASIRYARAEASRHAQPVTVCASDDGATCNYRRNANFADGWIVFLDFDGDGTKDASDINGNGEIDPRDEPVRRAVQPNTGDDVDLTLRAVLRGSTTDRRWVLSFDRNGMVRRRGGPRNGFVEPSFTYCDSAGASDAHSIFVSLSGRTVLSLDEDGNGKFDYNETDVTCP